jgi:hypothetical protein
MSRTEELEQQALDRRWAQTVRLQDWATELLALGKMLWDEDSANGWTVPPIKREPQLTVLVMIGAREFARFTRDESGIVGVFGNGKPQRFANRQEGFDAAVKRRIAMGGGKR